MEYSYEETTPKLAHIFLEMHIMDTIALQGTAKNEYLVKQIKRYNLHDTVSRGVISLEQAETFITELAAKTDRQLKR